MKSLEELKALKAKMQKEIGIRDDDKANIKIIVGMGTCGIAAGARPVVIAFTEEIAKHGLTDVAVEQMGCKGDCANEPIVDVYFGNEKKATYIKMTPDRAVRVVNEHIVGGAVVTEFVGDDK
ncbi:MAG: (2Fe-2S) ferredoxin domain-containing protein [Ruminococcaceae bacterium]|nr:(2Fe-2S) ferredoxin domain-containing protein [Oscillospiraceae bacterium]